MTTKRKTKAEVRAAHLQLTATRIRQIEVILMAMTAEQKAALKLYHDAPRVAGPVPHGFWLLVEYAHLKFNEKPSDEARNALRVRRR